MPDSRFAVHYRSLATHLHGVPWRGTNKDLIACLDAFEAGDPEFWRKTVDSIVFDLAPDADWWTGYERLCELLLAQNPRFVKAIMDDWVLEER